jgi:Ca-activated chloride channel homolog
MTLDDRGRSPGFADAVVGYRGITNMSFKKLLILVSVAFFTFAAVNGLDRARAQQSSTAPVPAPTPPPDEDDRVETIDTEAVNVLFTAQDRNRRLLLNLRPEDVRVFENGQPQDIVDFARQVDLPLSLAILIDTSVSQERTLPEEKAAAAAFIEAVVRPAKDEVAIISFTGESTLEQGMTNNLARLRRAIEQVQFVPPSGYIGAGVVTNSGRVPGTPPISGDNQMVAGSTAIWDAVWATSEEILGPAPEKTRRAIILLSDGDNTSGKKKLDDAIQAAQRAEAVIYSIGIGDNFYYGVDKGTLERISERTGGRAYFPKNELELREAFNQIQEEMRSQYLLAYEPTNTARDGSYRKIEIQLVNPELQKQKIKLTYRQGYFAKSGSKPGSK